MAKRDHSKKVTGNSEMVSLEQKDSIDDSILPNPDELKKYYAIDPNIFDFLKNYANKEQEHRHNFNNKQMETLQIDIKQGHTRTMAQIFSAWSIIIFGISISAFLLNNGHDVTGSILGSTSLISAVFAFLNFKPNNKSIK